MDPEYMTTTGYKSWSGILYNNTAVKTTNLIHNHLWITWHPNCSPILPKSGASRLMMTTQEFNFLLAISEFGWSRAQYHWYYLWLYDSEASENVAGSNGRVPVTRKQKSRGSEQIAVDQVFRRAPKSLNA
jgi:hypothetical protein